MIKISTKKHDPANPPDGVWVPYLEGAEIQIRKLTKEVLKALRAPFITISMDYDAAEHKYVEKEKIDTEKFEEALREYLVQNFRGFGDEEGNILQCNAEGRKALMNNLPVQDFVWGFANAAEMVAAARQTEEIKK